jgi:PTS system nitrogen regulatory IIA component
MKIVDYLTVNDVIPDMSSPSADDVLKEMSAHLQTAGKIDQVDELVTILQEREKLGSTGIGNGVAIPHGRLKGLTDILLVFGRSSRGVDFEAHDDEPVHLFFLLVAPEDSAGLHLKALARISRIMKNPDCRERLIASETPEDLFQVLRDEDDRY